MAKRPASNTIDPTERITQITRMAGVDFAGAAAMAQNAVAEGIDDPRLHGLIGYHLKDEGRFEEAIAEFGKLLEHDPRNAPLMCQVGFCLIELGRRQEAAQVFGAAVQLDPKSAEASFGYGWAAERLGALDSARSAWERAVKLDPGRADALAGLSGLAYRRRDWDEARRLAMDRAAALDPVQTDAPMTLARLDIGQGRLDAAEQRLRALLAQPRLKTLARANIHTMLGDTLDAAGRFEDAYSRLRHGQGRTEGPVRPPLRRREPAFVCGSGSIDGGGVSRNRRR